MALVQADRVKETSTTTGTGTYNLAGAVTGFQTFVAGIGTGNTCFYVATDGTDWEVGIGTVTDATPDTLARTTILESSNGDAAVNWGAGTKTIFCTLPASVLGSTTAGRGASLIGIADAGGYTSVTTVEAALQELYLKRCRIATGTYTGDGATSKAITGVGFQPKYVSIWERQTANNTDATQIETIDTMIDDNAAGYATIEAGVAIFRHETDNIIALGSDGFTVDDGGSDGDPNASGVVYNFLCIG